MRQSLKKLAGILLCLFVLFAVVQAFRVFAEVDKAEAELAALRETASALRQENESLRAALEKCGDPETISALAREELGFVLPEDKVIIEFVN